MDRRRFLPTYHYEDNTDGVLQNSVGKPLRDYKIYGNSKQNGTPSPDAPVEIVSVGDKTINLFDEGNFINMLIEAETAGSRKPIYETIDGKEYFRLYGTNCSYKDANGELLTNLRYSFKEKTQYTVSFDYVDVKKTGTDGVTRVGILLYIHYTDGSVKDFLINSGSRPNKAHVSFTTQADKTVDYVRFSYGTGLAYTYFANFQIAESSEEKEYEPFGYKVPIKVNGLAHNIYLTEPLRKAGEYADYVDYRNGCVVRNTQHVILDSSLNYTLVDMMLKVDCLEEQGTGLQGLCTYSPINTALMPGYMYLGENNNTVVVWVLRPSDLSGIAKNIDTFKAWLDSQTTPLEIVCERPTPLIESITLPTILLDKGTLHISVDTKEVKPSNVVWQYYRRGG